MNIEKTVQRMWRLMFWYLVTWVVWFGGLILAELQLFEKGGSLISAVVALSGASALVWGILLVLIVRQSRSIARDRRLREALDDDFMTLIKQKAAQVGFFGTLGTACVLVPFAELPFFSATAVVELIILLGVSTYLGSWLFLLKREDSDE